jgi:RluA family pseudouridine synthase
MERIVAALVREADAGRPLIDWLAGRFSYLDRESWKARIADGSISVDGERAEPGRALRAGERVAFSPGADAAEPETDGRVRDLYEDGDYLVVDKPGDLPCHPGGRFFKGTLWYLLRERLGEVRIATRLDRETSGCVVLCKNPEAARRFQRLHEAGRVEKRYLAMVHGAFPDELYAEGELTDDGESAVRKKRRFGPQGSGGEYCATRFALTERSGGLSLVRAELITGRTHQIRATLCSLGYPVVGDKLYGTDEARFLRFIAGALTEEDQEALMLDRQALHCESISFPSGSGALIRASCPALWTFPPRPEGRGEASISAPP